MSKVKEGSGQEGERRPLHVRLPKDLVVEVKVAAARQEISLQELVEKALRGELRRLKK